MCGVVYSIKSYCVTEPLKKGKLMIDSATGERKGQQMGFSIKKKKKKEYSKAQATEEKGLDFIKIKTSSLQRTLLRK